MKFLATITTIIMFSGYHVDAVVISHQAELDSSISIHHPKNAEDVSEGNEVLNQHAQKAVIVIEVAKPDSPANKTTAKPDSPKRTVVSTYKTAIAEEKAVKDVKKVTVAKEEHGERLRVYINDFPARRAAFNNNAPKADEEDNVASDDFDASYYRNVAAARANLKQAYEPKATSPFAIAAEERVSDFAARSAAFNNKDAKADSPANNTKTAKRKRVVSEYEKTIAEEKAAKAEEASRLHHRRFRNSSRGIAARANLKQAFEASTMPKAVTPESPARRAAKRYRLVRDYNQATAAKPYATSPDFKEAVITPGQVFQRREALLARKTQGDKDAFAMPAEERVNDFAERSAAFNNKAAKADSRANKDWRKERVFEFGSVRDQRDLIDAAVAKRAENEVTVAQTSMPEIYELSEFLFSGLNGQDTKTQILLKQSKPQYDSAMKELMRKRED